MPKIAAFVVIGLIPLSAPASRTHCVSFCSLQEGRTGASVFGLAMSKSALLVLSRGGCTPSLPLSLSPSHHWVSASARREQHVLFCLSGGAALHKALSCVHVDAGSVTAVTLWLSSPGLSAWDDVFTRTMLSIKKKKKEEGGKKKKKLPLSLIWPSRILTVCVKKKS